MYQVIQGVFNNKTVYFVVIIPPHERGNYVRISQLAATLDNTVKFRGDELTRQEIFMPANGAYLSEDVLCFSLEYNRETYYLFDKHIKFLTKGYVDVINVDGYLFVIALLMLMFWLSFWLFS